ncbi:MAG: UDP-N-acetylmuramoyl-tripeptide--D-alanyl-D-alanine ligase [Gammaproteobacteria bacterium]|nr:UDP-N-acetylmuramoyl-tripeptide--D-alanyl-D-alanine ligase [Gammaproteobacteria bacterium]
MTTLRYSDIARELNGRLIGKDGIYESISTDTRNIQAGSLFVALKGDRFDAHSFLDQAIAKGAAALLVTSESKLAVPQIVVADTRKALGNLARLWRQQFSIPVIAVTGSNGKTTVKEMIAAILSRLGETLSTEGNLNNDIGVPLTLLRLRSHHCYAVIEMGANHAGEIRYLSSIAQPQTAIITNAAPAHLEGFGSLQTVAESKAEIYSAIPATGQAIINADDAFASYWREQTSHCQRVEFGFSADADVRGDWFARENLLQIETRLGVCEARLPLFGQHNASNALAAAAAALSVGVGPQEIQQGLESMKPVQGRLYPRQGPFGMEILDDSYNANPGSLKAALNVLRAMPGRAWLVLGDMAELGQDARQLHYEMGLLAKGLGVERLFALGTLAAEAVAAFGENARLYNNADELITALCEQAGSEVNVLVKGSRAMRMEQVVAKLLDEQRTAGLPRQVRGH